MSNQAQQIALKLRTGAASDIWYDATGPENADSAALIADIQQAMNDAADILAAVFPEKATQTPGVTACVMEVSHIPPRVAISGITVDAANRLAPWLEAMFTGSTFSVKPAGDAVGALPAHFWVNIAILSPRGQQLLHGAA